MKVQVKVLMNQKEISEAKSLNEKNRNENFIAKSEGEPSKEYAEIEIPAEVIELKPMLMDCAKIEMATIGDAGMIHIFYMGKAFNVEFEQGVWDELEKRFDENQNRVYATAATSN